MAIITWSNSSGSSSGGGTWNGVYHIGGFRIFSGNYILIILGGADSVCRFYHTTTTTTTTTKEA